MMPDIFGVSKIMLTNVNKVYNFYQFLKSKILYKYTGDKNLK